MLTIDLSAPGVGVKRSLLEIRLSDLVGKPIKGKRETNRRKSVGHTLGLCALSHNRGNPEIRLGNTLGEADGDGSPPGFIEGDDL